MNELNFARFVEGSLSQQQTLDLLKKIDVSYCLQDESHLAMRTRVYTGYTFLHVAAKEGYDLKDMLDRGADLFKETLDWNHTPLLSTIESMIMGRMGTIKNENADLLLSTQIKRGNTLNPKGSNGINHFYVACMFNHLEGIKFFLDAGEPINQTVPSDSYTLPGYTALHFAIGHSCVEAVETLLNRGADIYLEDIKGKSSLDLLIERLIDLTDFIYMGKRACCLTVKEEIKRVESIVCYILEKKKSEGVNISNDNGLTALHLACTLSDTSIVEDYLQQSLDINASISDDSKFWPGYTPLHFAAHFNVGTVKLLLQRGSIITKNADGKTALDLCMERYSLQIIHPILLCRPEFETIVLSDGSTNLLDVLLLMNDCDKFNEFLKKSADVNMTVPLDSPLWPGNTLLHLSILMNEKTIASEEFYESYTFKENEDASKKLYNCAETQELTYWKRIVVCLVRGCSVSLKNTDGLTPLHLAFKLHKTKIVDKLLNSCKCDVADPNNLTHFHMACITGKKALVELLLSQKVDVNSSIKCSLEWYGQLTKYSIKRTPIVLLNANSTALHIAAKFAKIDIVELLLENGADVYAKDALGFTPIHLSVKFYSGLTSVARLILSKIQNLKEVVSNQGLTHLHVAAYANDALAIDKLIEAGSDVDAIFNYRPQSNDYKYDDDFRLLDAGSPLYLAVSENCSDAARALIRNGANVSKKIQLFKNHAKTPFIYALMHSKNDTTKYLINKVKQEFQDVIGPIDENGVTMLHVACACFDLMWVKKLLERGADVNAQVRDDDDYQDEWQGDTPLNVLLDTACNAEKLPKNLITLVKLLLKHGADVTIQNGQDYCYHTPLHLVYEQIRDKEDEDEEIPDVLFSLIDIFLKSHKSYDENPIDYNGYSHLHIACIRNNIEIVNNFLDNGVDINIHLDYCYYGYHSGFTPLHFAFDCNHKDLACLLIERGANVNAEATDGNTPLHIALKKNCADLEMLEMFDRNGADFNFKNLEGLTPFLHFIMMENFSFKQFDFFIKRKCEFTVTHFESLEGSLGLAMKNAIPDDCKAIFQKLIKTDDVKNAVRSGFNAIHSIVAVNQNGRITKEFYVYAIKRLMKMGCDLDQQDEEEKAPIHKAIYFYNKEAIEALLQLGTDLNIVNSKNESPLSTTTISVDSIEKIRRYQVKILLISHVWKMKFLGLDLKNSLEKSMLSLVGKQRPICPISECRCKNELQKLENAKIGDSLNAKNFICKGISNYPSMTSLEKAAVDDFFKDSEKITQTFLELGGILNMQYRKAICQLK